jgi:hypothetical protein
MKMSSAIVTIDQTGECGNHMNMLTIDSEAMIMAATHAQTVLQKSGQRIAVRVKKRHTRPPDWGAEHGPHARLPRRAPIGSS